MFLTGFPTDNMKDDVTQVVYELLHDMKDRVVCDVSHFQLVCNKGRSCKISPRIHKFDTGMKIRVAPGLAMPQLSKLLTGGTDVTTQNPVRLPTTKGYKFVDETKPKKSSKKCSKNKTSSEGGSQHTASDSVPDHLPSSVTHISDSSLPTTLPQLPQPEAGELLFASYELTESYVVTFLFLHPPTHSDEKPAKQDRFMQKSKLLHSTV